jgi:hypothetical protein
MLGLIVVIDVKGFMQNPSDGGLLDNAMKSLGGVLEEPSAHSCWMCLADSPEELWIAANASDDLKQFNQLRISAQVSADFCWQFSPRGAVLHEIVANHLCIAHERLEREHYRFTWWPGQIAQRFSAWPAKSISDGFFVPVSADMKLVVRTSADEVMASLVMDELNGMGSGTSAMCWSRTDRAVYMTTSRTIHLPWLLNNAGMFVSLALLAARDAHDLVDEIISRIGGVPDASSAPGAEARKTTDDLLNIRERVFAPSSGAWNICAQNSEFELAREKLEASGFSIQQDNNFLVASTRCSLGEVRLQYEAVHRSKAGSGAWLTLILPVHDCRQQIAIKANRLNLLEVSHVVWFPLQGAWRALPLDDSTYALGFSSFMPSVLSMPGSLLVGTVLQLGRLEWIEEDRTAQAIIKNAVHLKDGGRYI